MWFLKTIDQAVNQLIIPKMSLLPVLHNFSKLGNSHPAVELILDMFL